LQFLQDVVAEINWQDRLSELNHCRRFPYYATFFLDTVPVSCFGGETQRLTYQPKYAENVLKIQLCCDALGRIVFFFSGPHPGTRSDSTLWKEWGPEELLPGEVGLADGIYSGNAHLITPFRKPANKSLPHGAVRYNEVHSFYRARVEHCFGRLWVFSTFRDVWRGKGLQGAGELSQRVYVLLHLVNFALKRKLLYEPMCLGLISHKDRQSQHQQTQLSALSLSQLPV
jgi:hypothetical protein